ncbi:hypothetical protein HanXRQr2_Chr11g0471791 [Helianthus annuus]|uniref:Uncharacterized protein n=1 Tax=Helianthus annuus TaxID=4232 RepID=A0A251T8G6_HELAN|nr:hypothetical protein HanXRQr2_Chr11g0471791 [Helianthus annuus]KAJ0516079.1 hypothetical protein HanHA89_Chr11g0409891 [Helianthus annuus]
MHHHYYTFNNSISVSATPHPHLINVRSHLFSDNFPNSNLVSTLNSKKTPIFNPFFFNFRHKFHLIILCFFNFSFKTHGIITHFNTHHTFIAPLL